MKYSAITKDRLQTNRFVIPYRVYGNGGPHLVCLNGVQQSMAMWQSFIRQFAGHYRIVLFDFPGQGKGHIESGSPNVSLDEQVDILHDVIKESGVKDVTICSASWGGVVAMVFATKYPRMVRRLVLGSLGTKPNQRMVETIQKGFTINSNDREKMADTLIDSFGQDLPNAIKKRITNQFVTMSPDHLKAFCEQGLFVISAKNLKDVVDFKKIKAETVLIHGENDTIIDLEDVKYLATQIPQCRIQIVNDTGHFLHLESDAALDIYEKALPDR